jgi:putative ABC transport system substrate-binding protein
MNRRRRLLALSCWAAAWLAALARAQPARGAIRRVAVLAPSIRAREEVTLKPFFDEMRSLGWIEGRNIDYDRAYGDDNAADLARLAVDLVGRQPDLIFAPPSPAAVAARNATTTIPIVFATGTDPVGIGLVASLAKPGGNVTGVLSVAESLAPKLLQMVREILPRARRLGLLYDPSDPRARIDRDALSAPAAAMGFSFIVADVTEPAALGPAVAALAQQKVDAILTSTSLLFNLRVALLELANARRLPVVGHRSELADAGAVLTYGAPLPNQLRRAAALVDKVLKGTPPSAIPVEQPTYFELVVNVRAAAALGVTIPATLRQRADRVIQ